jgi:hypothetical protein
VTLALLLPAGVPPEQLAALERALAAATNLASDVRLENEEDGGMEADAAGAAASHGRSSDAQAAATEAAAAGAAAAVRDAAAAAGAALRRARGLPPILPAAGAPPAPPAPPATPASPSAAASASASAAASALAGINLLAHVDAEDAKARENASQVQGVAARIAKGGELVADAVIRGKGVASQGVHLVGALVKHKVAPNAARRSVPVAPGARAAIAGTHRLTEIALEGSRFALSTAAYTFKFVGTSVSASVQETKLYQQVVALAHRRAAAADARAAADAAAAAAAAAAASGDSCDASSAAAAAPKPPSISDDVHKAKLVLGTVLTSCLGVYRTCKAALWEFTDDLKDLTVDVCDHFYGDDVANAAGTTFDAVRNVGTIMINVDAMPSGASNVAFNVAKESGLDILSLDEWLSGGVLAHGYVDMFSPIATWVPQWLLLRSSAVLIYNVCTGKATRPVEVLLVGDLASCAQSVIGSEEGWHFDIATQDAVSYRVRVRVESVRDAWVDAIAGAIAVKKAAKPKLILTEGAEGFVEAEKMELAAWHDALGARLAAWEAKFSAEAAKAREASDSWATLQSWAGAEAAAAAAEAAAEMASIAARVPAAVEASLPGEGRAQLARARAWAAATLAAAEGTPPAGGTPGGTDAAATSSASGCVAPATLAAADEAARAWFASHRLCAPEPSSATAALALSLSSSLLPAARAWAATTAESVAVAADAIAAVAEDAVDAVLPPIPADALARAREWAESVEGHLSPGTAAAARRADDAAASREAAQAAMQMQSREKGPRHVASAPALGALAAQE